MQALDYPSTVTVMDDKTTLLNATNVGDIDLPSVTVWITNEVVESDGLSEDGDEVITERKLNLDLICAHTSIGNLDRLTEAVERAMHPGSPSEWFSDADLTSTDFEDENLQGKQFDTCVLSYTIEYRAQRGSPAQTISEA